MRTCPACGEELPDRFRVCGYCGTPLPAAPPPVEVRKTVTIVFSDLAGSTALGERLDSESLRAVMDRYFDAMRDALERHGGTVEKFIGDAVMAVFGLPTLHEDDALRAVRAAAAMSEALTELNGELEARFGVRLANRTGVNTGEVVAGDPTGGQRLVTGDAVNVAARLEQAAPSGEVLLGPLTHRLVRAGVHAEPVEPLVLKGKSERVPAYRLLGLRDAGPDRELPPLVAREGELAALAAALEEVRSDGRCRLRVVLGAAGVGKSRLIDEFGAAAAPAARVLRGRCLPYGRGITFWPLAELVKGAAGVTEADLPEVAQERLAGLAGPDGDAVRRRVAAAIGLSTESFPLDELFWGARRLLERLAAEQPVVAVVEDLHWAERSFLAFLEHLTLSAEAPILLLGSARPEVLDLDDALGAFPGSERLELEPLSGDATAAMLDGLAAPARLPPEVRAALVDGAGGNPLFAEQMLSMLIDDGRLVREGGAWRATVNLATVEVPPTMQALVAARLDQLASEERGVLEPASVVGNEFEVDAVRALVGPDARDVIEPRLAGLDRKQLVAELDAAPPAYRFQHALIRDGAYARLLKRVRAELHERFVTWAESAYALREHGDELEELLGYHLEQAHRYLRELAPLDEHGRALGARAAQRLGSAGRRALDREDTPAAASLLRRAALSFEVDDARRVPLLLGLSEALMDIGEFAAAQAQAETAADLAAARGNRPAEATARVIAALLHVQAAGHDDSADRIVHEGERAVAVLAGSGEDGWSAAVHRCLAWAHGTAGRYGRAAAAAEAAMRHASRAGDDRQRRRAAAQYATVALYGPTPVPDAIARCEAILRQEQGDRRTEGLVGSLLARLVAMGGDVERARELSFDARAKLRELGPSLVGASTSLEYAGVEVLAGDLAAAESALRADKAELEAMGDRYLRSLVAGELARVLAEQGRDAEAWDASREAERLCAVDDVVAQALWRQGRARLLGRAGRHDEACALADDAIRLLRDTDDRVTQADALTDLAAVRAQAGLAEPAAEALRETLALLEAKADVMGVSRVRAIAELDGFAASPGEAHMRIRPL